MDKLAGFIPWHYTKGLEIYVTNWIRYFDSIVHYFSLPLLLKTLFAPWKRLIDYDESPGFDLQRYFQKLTFNVFSRFIGAVVRLGLFFVGVVFFIFTFLAGIIGLFLWFLIPFLSIPLYLRWIKNPTRYVQELFSEVQTTKKPLLEVLFTSLAGLEMIKHLGVDEKLMVANANTKRINISEVDKTSMESVFKYLVTQKVWTNQFLKKQQLAGEDLIIAAALWDKKRLNESYVLSPPYAMHGIGLELTFGYTPTLNRFSYDLGDFRSYSHRLIGREQVVSRMERVLSGGNSVILVGEPGVGKKTIVLEFAHRARIGHLGQGMSYRRVLEFDHNSLLSGSVDLNRKKKQLSNVFREAAAAGNIILAIRDLHRMINSQVEGVDFTDIFETALEGRDLKIIVVTTPDEYERFIVPNMRLRKFFETVEAVQPTLEEALEILIESATKWEMLRNIIITVPALRRILNESNNYITETPFPEKAIELLDAVVLYRQQQEDGNIVTVDDVNVVLSEKTGISFARLTGEEKKLLGNLEEVIHERLVDQETAVDLIAKSLRARTVAKTRKERPLGSFLFLGPTGVGKTQTAKVLAKVYYGDEAKILRFDMAEFAGGEGFERIVGSTYNNQPGELTKAIKNNPASLLLLDELEKATPQVFNVFLRLLDEGVMTDAFGKKVNGRHLFIIGTSNAGAEYVRQLVSQGVHGENLQRQVLEHVFNQGIFTPEFINRFDGVVVYEPLREEDLVKIAAMLLKDFAVDLEEQNIYLEVTRGVCEKLAKDGYIPEFGARPMARIVNLTLGDIVGRAILSNTIVDGDVIRIVPGRGKEEFSIEKIGNKG